MILEDQRSVLRLSVKEFKGVGVSGLGFLQELWGFGASGFRV